MSDFRIYTSILFSPIEKQFLNDITLSVSPKTGLITKVHKRSAAETSSLDGATIASPDIDLRSPGPNGKPRVILPGLVDAHTHIFLHAYSDTPSLNQMRDESPTERTVRAVNHCRTALLAGYTTYRDLGTEGMLDHDIHIRNAINRGIIPGPRLFVATECVASSGGYAVRLENITNGVPRIADVGDGVDGVRAAVRRRVGAGADIVKFYADYRKRQLRYPPSTWPGEPDIQFPPKSIDRNPNVPLFNQEEMDAIVREAKLNSIPVAAHAQAAEAVIMAAKAGVTSIEHGFEPSGAALAAMKEAGCIFVPTLAVLELFLPMEAILAHTRKAWDMGIKLACGGDTGAFDHGQNAREIELFIEAGIPLEEVLTASTLHGWETCGGELCGRKFGCLEEGWAADLVALEGDPREDTDSLRRVEFVMKDGRVWKKDGVAVGIA
ncbi:hypothetical protein NA57DRAFT_64724 [Rhizodiscina lignyota]|uniref:Amidohydrolase-related domain-containing protein n=1 Tax=Rhizodiscina lignyota TaxID=1504668 RepID=A0A9P4M8Y3_9PEZI|nr:hypothetical protein NA57DRAFT_64724 [Rhizodiscina lignyota]